VTRARDVAARPLPVSSPEIHAEARLLALLDQQAWLFGCDIERPSGNLLLEYGFERHRPPPGIVGCPAYRFRADSEATMVLRGFGFFSGRRRVGGVFLPRRSLAIRALGRSDLGLPLWDPARLPRERPVATVRAERIARSLLVGLCEGIGDYEEWVGRRVGLGHRRRCLRRWPRPVTSPGEVARAWRAFAELVRREPCWLRSLLLPRRSAG
jgi:hypothetical protein